MKWLNESMNKSKNLKDTYSLHDIEIFIKDQNARVISIWILFLNTLKAEFLQICLRGVDMIYVGKFKHLEDKEVNAIYSDGAIYLTNDQDDDKDLIDDIIHEIAHSVEDLYGHGIYDDGSIVREFLGKRKRLYADLLANDYNHPKRCNTKQNTFKKLMTIFIKT
jgi:hypothetical protein